MRTEGGRYFLETQIIHDDRLNRPKRVCFPVSQHGTDLLHYTTYDISAGAKMAFAAHWHPEYEIILQLDGYIEFVVDGELFHLDPGEALFINGDSIHGHAEFCADYGRYLCFSFGEDFIFPDPKCYIYNRFFMPVKSGRYTFTKHITGKSGYEREIIEIIEKLRILSGSTADHALSIQICLLGIFDIMFRENAFDAREDSFSSRKDLLRSALWYMNEHYTSQISVPDIANFLGVSSDHFRRIFKAAAGSTPKDYIQNLRIRHAIGGIESNPGRRLAEIASEAGFDDPNYFARIFKMKTGLSPSDYQKLTRRGISTEI